MNDQTNVMVGAILGTLLVIVIGLISTLFIGFLNSAFWNISIAEIFNLPELNVIQGSALFLLTNLLFATPIIGIARK